MKLIQAIALLLIPAGYLITADRFEGFGYFLESLFSFLALGMLLVALSPKARSTEAIPVWITLGVFLFGYYLKFFWLTGVDPYSESSLFSPNLQYASTSDALMLKTYELITIGFVSFCISAAAFIRMLSAPKDETKTETQSIWIQSRASGLISLCFVFTVALMGLSAFIQVTFNIGVMGVEAVYLPGKVVGVVYLARSVFIPVVWLALIWLADAIKHRPLYILSILMLFVHALTDMVITTSRGSLITMLLPVLILWANIGKLDRKKVYFFGAVLIAASTMYPLVSGLRIARAVHGHSLSIETVQDVVSDLGRYNDNQLQSSLGKIVLRVSGTDSLVYAADWPAPEFPSVSSLQKYVFGDRPFANTVTHEVAGIPVAFVTHSEAVTLLGGLYLIGGYIGIILGVPLYILTGILCFRALATSNLVSKPVIVSVGCIAFFQVTSEFCVDWYGIPRALAILLGVCIAELIVRFIRKPDEIDVKRTRSEVGNLA